MKKVYLILVLGLIWSCSNDNDEGGTTDPTSGNISGTVNLYDEGTSQVDNSGMTVRVDGLSISATTDENGRFTLVDVPFGTYSLSYEKTGYGTFKRFDVNHNLISTVIPDTPSLGEFSSTAITDLTSGTSNGGETIVIGATTDPVANNANRKYIQFFFSDNPNVSNTNFNDVLEPLLVQITPYNLNLTQESFQSLGYQSGQTIYVKCYGTSFWGNRYFDPQLGRDVFPNLNSSAAAAVSFVVP
jgi:hypothetical protein